MGWFLAIIVLIVALLTQRSARVRAAIVAVLFAVLAAGIYFRLTTPPTAVEPASTTPAAGRDVVTIPLDEIQVTGLEMTGTGAPWRVTGTIANQSSLELLSFTLAVTRRDCYAGALDASGCVILWRGEQLVSALVPAHTTRKFSVAIRPHTAVTPKGESRDTFEVKRPIGR